MVGSFDGFGIANDDIDGVVFKRSLNNGDGGLVSLINGFGFGGDFFNVDGGEGGGGAFNAGIVIGEGTFFGENAGDIGELSFSISCLTTDIKLSGLSPNSLSSAKPFLKLELSVFDFPFLAEPFLFWRFAGFCLFIIFPFTTDTVTSSSPPGRESSSSPESLESLSKSAFELGFGDGFGETLGLENRGSRFGDSDLLRSSLIDDTHDNQLSPSAGVSDFDGMNLNVLKIKI